MNHKKSRKKRRAMRAYRTLLFSSENAKLAGRRTWRYKRSDPTAEAGLLGRRLNCCRRQNCDEDEPFDLWQNPSLANRLLGLRSAYLWRKLGRFRFVRKVWRM